MTWSPTSADYPLVRAGLERLLRAQASGHPAPIDPDLAAWLGHLQWLNSCLEARVLSPIVLLKDEFEGLRLLDELTRELQAKLIRCPHCGRFTDRGLTCRTCARPLTRPE